MPREMHKRITFSLQDMEICVSPAEAVLRPPSRQIINIQEHILPCLSSLLNPLKKPALSFLMSETIESAKKEVIDFAYKFPLYKTTNLDYRNLRQAAAYIAACFTDILIRQNIGKLTGSWQEHVRKLIAFWHQADEPLLEDGQHITVYSKLEQKSDVKVIREIGRQTPINLVPFGINIEGATFRSYEIECLDFYHDQNQSIYLDERTEPQIFLEYASAVYRRRIAL